MKYTIDDIEIILVTYNRHLYLRRTLEQLFVENSPIKTADITILDNKSTDETAEVIERFQKKYKNLKHIVHNKNIGGNANIARAFEMATKKYVWVLCDDDYYDWSNWSEVQLAIEQNKDAICVSTYALRDRSSKEDLLLQMTFVPGCIYKTEHITETVLRNMYENIWNSFPQLAITIHLFNNNKDIHVLSKPIVDNGLLVAIEKKDEFPDVSFHRGDNPDELFPTTRNFYWHSGFANSLVLLKDKKLAQSAIVKARTNKALDPDISDQNVLNHVVRLVNHNFPEESMPIFWNYYYRCDKKTRLKLIKLLFRKGRKVNKKLDSLLYDYQPQQFPKWFVHIVCWFIPKRRNRRHFRTKHTRK